MGTGRLRAVFAVSVAAALWGTTGTAASFLPDTVSPLATGSATMAIGGFLLAVTAPRGSWRVLRAHDARPWLIAGAVGVFVYPLAFYSGMSLAGVAVGNVVALGTGPVVTAVLERVVDGRRLSRRWAVATLLAASGVAALLAGRGGAGAPQGLIAGVLCGVLAGIAYGVYTYASARAIATGASSRGVMGAVFGCGAVLLTPVLLATGGPLTATPTSVSITAYLALGPMFIAYLLVGRSLRTLTASTVTTIALLEPVVATLLAVIVVGERLGAISWLGIAGILLGIVVLVAARLPRHQARSDLDFEA